MNRVKTIIDTLKNTIASWQDVNCILAGKALKEDVLDPYFVITLDVYYKDCIPDSDTRNTLFEYPGAFETSPKQDKDRFFIDELPVHIIYKKQQVVENYLVDYKKLFQEGTTYSIFRIFNADIIYNCDTWITAIQEQFSKLGEAFWGQLFKYNIYKIEHYLTDLGSAVMKHDDFFFLVSLSGFMTSCASALFARNHEWFPYYRKLNEYLCKLKVVPENFSRYWNDILNTGKLTQEKRYQLAQLLAKEIILQPFVVNDTTCQS